MTTASACQVYAFAVSDLLLALFDLANVFAPRLLQHITFTEVLIAATPSPSLPGHVAFLFTSGRVVLWVHTSPAVLRQLDYDDSLERVAGERVLALTFGAHPRSLYLLTSFALYYIDFAVSPLP